MGRSFGLNRAELLLAYDRDLVHRAKEIRKNPMAAERKLWEQCLSKFPHGVLRQRPIATKSTPLIWVISLSCGNLKTNSTTSSSHLLYQISRKIKLNVKHTV